VRIEVLPTAGQLQLDGTALDAGDTVTVSQIDAGQLSYLPGTDRFGPDDASFEFSVIDDNTQPGDSIALASNQLTVSVDPVSDAPTGSDSIQIAVEDTSYVFATADFGFTDPSDGDTLTGVFIEQLPAGGTLTLDGAAVNAGDFIITNEIAAGTLQYLTATNANGAAYDTIGFRVMDSGTDGPASIDSAVRQLTFDVLDVNDAPAAENNTITTAEDTEYVLGQSDFSFSDVADGNAFSSITVTTLPDLGTLLHQGIAVEAGDTISSAALDAGVLVYQPPLNVSTPVTDATELAPNGFSFSVTDDGGLARGGENTSIEQFITIDLTPVNDPPVLVSKEATVDEGGTIVIDSALLSGEDPDDSGLDELELTLTTLPLHGQLLLDGEVITAGTSLTLEAIEAGSLSYVHDSSETSADGFNVSLADGGEDGALPAEGRFELAINEVIDAAPELNPDALQLAFGQSFDSSEGQLLASGFSSLNNGSLSDNTDWLVELEVPPSHGTVELQADGTFTYVHNGSAILNDEFSYRVTNEDGVFTIATVAVTIEPRIAQALEESSNTFEAPTEQPEALTTEEPAEQEVTQASEEPEPEAQPARQAAPLLPDNNSIGNTRNTAILTQVETRELPGVNSSQTELVTRQAIAVTQHRDVIGVVASQYDLQELSTTTYDLTLDVHIPVLTISPSNPVFQNALTQLDNDFAELEEEGGARYELATDSVLGASFSASVGALAWILRGGAMFGSMMAFTPLWKFIEIGQVSVMVGGTNGRSKDNPGGEDDQLESLFDDSK